MSATTELDPFIDGHIHLVDRAHDQLRYQWLDEEATDPSGGSMDAIASRRYLLPDFVAETRFNHVVGAVHVQAAIGTDDPVAETQWLSEQADACDFPLRIVADAELASDTIEETLDRHAAHWRLRGIRDFTSRPAVALDDAAFRRGYALLAKHDLSFELNSMPPNLHTAVDLLEAFPESRLVIGHTGFPQQRDDEYFATWRADMAAVASCLNAMVKISGLGMGDPRWTVASIRPWVEATIELFGVERCMFATNWPYDRLYSSYTDVAQAYREITAGFSSEERTALFSANAAAFYGF